MFYCSAKRFPSFFFSNGIFNAFSIFHIFYSRHRLLYHPNEWGLFSICFFLTFYNHCYCWFWAEERWVVILCEWVITRANFLFELKSAIYWKKIDQVGTIKQRKSHTNCDGIPLNRHCVCRRRNKITCYEVTLNLECNSFQTTNQHDFVIASTD